MTHQHSVPEHAEGLVDQKVEIRGPREVTPRHPSFEDVAQLPTAVACEFTKQLLGDVQIIQRAGR